MHVKRFTIGLAAGILLILALTAVIGVGTAGAAPAKSYCLDHQTLVTDDPGPQGLLDWEIQNSGGAFTTAEVDWTGTTTPVDEPSGSFIDQYYAPNVGFDDGAVTQAQFALDYGPPVTVGPVQVHQVSAGACPVKPVRPANRSSYCSVAGDTHPDGTPITPGTFLDLLQGQPDTDKHYTGAVPA